MRTVQNHSTTMRFFTIPKQIFLLWRPRQRVRRRLEADALAKAVIEAKLVTRGVRSHDVQLLLKATRFDLQILQALEN